ncbi:DNA-(apurinic or apyrimidinic site) lyase [Choanephora cucurbitarum]|uniref:DNA-(Apurinic or apyrimidinic site) lyase n=1 Tax=Choanephora cucurbitarum TaxID=101091 RepID=A0A1C7N102_9FUNG|nr:DNA-(apurinic or apyrimidinic site) lyase [Choanephora cucurbitarum]
MAKTVQTQSTTVKLARKRSHSTEPVEQTEELKKPKLASKPKAKAWEPFDPSLPNNMTFPEKFNIPVKPEGSIKITSYNVAGLQACIKKGFNRYIDAEDADIVCIQEHKLSAALSTAVNDKIYKYRYWGCDEKKGYAGVAFFSKFKPEKIIYGIPGYEQKTRGRVISLTFPSFTIIGCYVPNAGDKLVRLPERRVFNEHMEKYIRSLQKEGKSVIWTGDLNVAHTENDLARPETNQRSAGFTIEERTDFSKVLSPSEEDSSLPGLIDTWRHFNPEQKGHYTFYGYRFKCREKLMGWRLDYFTVTPDLMDHVVSSEIRHEGWGASDHVPLVLTLKDVKMQQE